tara:strand:+ start:10666 stop:10905 length:240 start_codon:yes stop_codon:yes gene_type:complete
MSVIDNSDLMEISCEIADMLLMEKFNHDYSLTHMVEDDMSRYTEEAQPVFDEYYDDIMSMLKGAFRLEEMDDGHWKVKL